jgi:hypothetical protein
MWRHGDVLVAAIDEIPADAKQLEHVILARGEMTGHAHRIADSKTAILYETNGLLFVKVIADKATLVHEEHKPIELPRGTYRVWQQREYTPQEIRRVYD